jgi:hypothetical protein
VVRGEAGIGKSRLITAFREWLTSVQGYSARTSACEEAFAIAFHGSPNHTNTTLYPIVRQLERLAAFELNDADAVKRKKLAALLNRCGVSGQSETLALLADLLAIAPDAGHPIAEITPRAKRQRTFEAIEIWIGAITARQPLLLVVEDLQWMDPSTHTVLDRLATLSATSRMLMLASERTGPLLGLEMPDASQESATASWFGNPHVAICDLHELGEDASLQLISLTANTKALPAVLIEAVLKKSDGIPLYIEELTRGLIETDMIVDRWDRNAWKGEPSSLVLPNSLRGSLMARLDRVGPAKEVAQHAAVIGREFSLGSLAKTSPLSEDRLRAGIERLLAANIIRGDGSVGDPVYQFKHALIQDAAYHSLLRRQRRELHLRLAERLEAEKGRLSEVTDDLIATHYARAAAPQRAIAAWRRAARTASQLSAQHEAANLLQLALGSLPELPNTRERRLLELELTMELASTLGPVRGQAAPEVENQYLRARELCIELGETRRRFNIEFGLMFSNLVKGDLDRANQFAQGLFAHADHHPSKPYVDAYLGNGMVTFQQGRFAECRGFLEKGAALAHPERDQPHFFTHGQNPGLFCRSYLAQTLAFMAEWQEATAVVEANLSLARKRASEPSHVYSYVVALAFACRVYFLLGDGASVNLLSKELIHIAQRNHYAFYEAFGRAQKGWALAQSKSDDALRLGATEMCDGLASLEHMETRVVLPGFYARLAEIYIRLGDKVKAVAALHKAEDKKGQITKCWDAEIARVRGEAHAILPQANPSMAIRSFRAALNIARVQGARTLELKAIVSYARFLWQINQTQDAYELLRPYIGAARFVLSDGAFVVDPQGLLAEIVGRSRGP